MRAGQSSCLLRGQPVRFYKVQKKKYYSPVICMQFGVPVQVSVLAGVCSHNEHSTDGHSVTVFGLTLTFPAI